MAVREENLSSTDVLDPLYPSWVFFGSQPQPHCMMNLTLQLKQLEL